MAYFFPVIISITLFFSLNSVHASSLLPAPDFRIWSPNNSGGWNINYGSNSSGGSSSGNVQVLSGGTQVRLHNLWDVPSSSGKSYRVPLSHTSTVDLLKVGSALGSIARKLSPVGMAIGTAAYICSETNICDIDGLWTIPGTLDPNDYPTTTPIQSYCTSGFCSGQYDTRAPTASESCRIAAEVAKLWGNNRTGSAISSTQCEVRNATTNDVVTAGPIAIVASCPPKYSNSGGQCVLTESNESRTPTTQDWDDAEATLNQPASTQHIIDNGGYVPADSSSPPLLENAPITQPIGTTTTTLYDANNNATGTQTKETTLTITDGATLDAPNQITYNETTVTNNYDLSNNLIDRTVTDTSAPPPAPPEIGDIEIEFDSVPENELEEYETPDMDDWTSWGSGACPPPISINTNHWNGVLDTQPMCDFAEGINPFVLLFAALISAYIVAGIRTSGH